jgi:hypothetical protein
MSPTPLHHRLDCRNVLAEISRSKGLTVVTSLPRIEYVFDIGSDSSRLPQRPVRTDPR